MHSVLPIASWRNLLVATLAALTISGCSSTEGQDTFYIARALNLVTDSPVQTVDIGALSFRAAFASGSGYSSAFAGSGEIEVRGFVPGANPGDSFEDTLVLRAAENAEFADATAYTIINYGTVADFRSLIISNSSTEAVDPDNNIVQVVHAAAGVGGVDIYVTDPDADLAGTAPSFTLSAGQVSTERSITFATHRVRITSAGTTDVVFDSGSIRPVLPGRILYVIGKSLGPGASPVFLNQWFNQGSSAAIADTDSGASVRLMHMSPDTGALDWYAEDDYAAPLVTGAAFRELSAYVTTTDTLPDGPTVFENTRLDFSGTAVDAEDGDVAAMLTWTSTLDGPLGEPGESVEAILTAGDHSVIASVTDSGGLTGTDAITVRVLPTADAAPTVSITSPPSRISIASGTAVTLTATADDASDGDLSAGLSWTSSIDGVLPGMGGSTSATLSPGVHAITASVGDSNGTVGADTIIVPVTSGGNTAPAVSITAPDINGVEFDLTLAGDPDSLLLQDTQQVFDGTVYTYLLSGSAGALDGTLLADAVQKVATHSQLRFLNASNVLESFDAYLTAPGTGIADASPVLSGLTAGNGTSFTSIPGRAYDITLTDAGSSDVVLLIPSLLLADNTLNTLVIVEDAGATVPDFELFID